MMMSNYKLNMKTKLVPRDVVATVSKKSGLVKYGEVVQTNIFPLETGSKARTKEHVIVHPMRMDRYMVDELIALINRPLRVGDVVRKGPDGQIGHCENVYDYATVKILNTNKIIENVSCQGFTLTVPFALNTPVAYESWAGDVHDVHSDITFASQDGSIFILDYTPPRKDDILHEHKFPCTVIYVGRKLKLRLATIKRAKFISKSDLLCDLLDKHNKHNKMKFSAEKSTNLKIEVYIKDITVKSVEVHWYERNLEGSPRIDMFGDYLKKLKSLDFLRICRIELSDIYQYTIKENDNLLSMKQWRSKCFKNVEKLLNTKKLEKKAEAKFLRNNTNGDHPHDSHPRPIGVHRIYQDFGLKENQEKPIKMAKVNRSELPPIGSSSVIYRDDERDPRPKPIGLRTTNQDICLKEGQLKDINEMKIDKIKPSTSAKVEANFITDKQNLSDPRLKSKELRRTNQDFCLKKHQLKDIVKEIKMAKIKPTSAKGNGPILKLKSIRLQRNRIVKLLVRESRKKHKPLHIPNVSTKINSKVDVKICSTKSVIDVIWQDGTKESGVLSTDLYPVNNLHGCELFPGTFVEEKNGKDPNKYGIVESVQQSERTARVQWFEYNHENPLPVPLENVDYSLYDLVKYNPFNFKSGTFVKHRVCPDTIPELNIGKVLHAETNGQILVMGVNGEKTRYWPHELSVVKDHNNSAGKNFQLEIYSNASKQWVTISGYSNNEGVLDQHIFQAIPKLINKNVSQKGVKFDKHFTKIFYAIEHEEQNHKLVEKLSKTLGLIKMGLMFAPFDSEQIKLLDDVDNMLSKCQASVLKMFKCDYSDGKLKLDTSKEPRKNKKDKLRAIFLELKNKIDEMKQNLSVIEKKNMNSDIEPVILGPNDSPASPVKRNTSTKLIPLESPNELTELFPLESPLESSVPECEDIARPEEAGVFEMVGTLGYNNHKYANEYFDAPLNKMLRAITKDIQILQKSLPAGIWVKTFEDRMDLISVMIRGPENTPYDGGLFIFDIKLLNTYPDEPPLCHYHSFCHNRLNPNLYEDGKVCLSLLGTWAGDSMEQWSPIHSNLLQLLVSIQGLILVREPFYNEPGTHHIVDKDFANDKSREYNETTLIKVVQSMTKMLNLKENTNFENEIMEHFKTYGSKLISTTENWIKLSGRELSEDEKLYPGYPLLPLTKGCCLSLNKALNAFKDCLTSLNISFE